MEIELTRHSHPQSDLRDLIEGNEVFAAQTLAVREWMFKEMIAWVYEVPACR